MQYTLIYQYMSTYLLLEEIRKLSLLNDDELIKKLWIHKGTFNRWIKEEKVPDNYFNELNKILDYKYKSKDTFRDKDQFFTKPEVAKHCYSKLQEVLRELQVDTLDYEFIEPSAWNWVFYDLLPTDKRIWVDIEPKREEFIYSDYLDFEPHWSSSWGKYIVIWNPPFWLRGNLAYRFIKHSEKFADIVCFILPPLFDSQWKGSPMNRVFRDTDYELAYSEKLSKNSFEYPDWREADVSTILQVWTKINKEHIKEEFKIRNPSHKRKYINSTWALPQNILDTIYSSIKIYSLSDGWTPATTRNKKMLDKCDLYIPSTLFWDIQLFSSFSKLPNKRWYGIVVSNIDYKNYVLQLNKEEWKTIWFNSTNWATNTRKELIEEFLVKKLIEFEENKV